MRQTRRSIVYPSHLLLLLLALVGLLIVAQLPIFSSTGAAHGGRFNSPTPTVDEQPWATIGRDARHSNQSPYLGPQILTAPRVTQIPYAGQNAMVIDRNGVIYAPTARAAFQTEGRVYAFNPDGSVRPGWPFTAAVFPQLGPAVGLGPDGTIYATFAGRLYALNRTARRSGPPHSIRLI